MNKEKSQIDTDFIIVLVVVVAALYFGWPHITAWLGENVGEKLISTKILTEQNPLITIYAGAGLDLSRLIAYSSWALALMVFGKEFISWRRGQDLAD